MLVIDRSELTRGIIRMEFFLIAVQEGIHKLLAAFIASNGCHKIFAILLDSSCRGVLYQLADPKKFH